MRSIMFAIALVTTVTSAAAMAQIPMSFKAGANRATALASAEKAFNRMDQNSDGKFDIAETTAVLQARAAKNGKTFKRKAAGRMISRSDGNGDGSVTLDEFKTAAGTRFDSTDANKNGTIDLNEGRRGAAAIDDGETN